MDSGDVGLRGDGEQERAEERVSGGKRENTKETHACVFMRVRVPVPVSMSVRKNCTCTCNRVEVIAGRGRP